MSSTYSEINNFLVTVFNEVLRTEEMSLKTKDFKNLSMREMHVIEAVCNAVETESNTASQIASSQKITPGTLTATIITLEKKGFVLRQKDARDKRSIRIVPTEKGIHANEVHASFHHEMVSSIMSAMQEDELAMFVKGLASVQDFLKNKRQ